MKVIAEVQSVVGPNEGRDNPVVDVPYYNGENGVTALKAVAQVVESASEMEWTRTVGLRIEF